MANFANDGDIPFGSEVVTINAVPYVAEEIEPQEKATSIIRRNEINVPNGAVHIKDLIKAKMTLQLADIDTPIPELLSIVSFDFRGSSKDFIVSDVSQPLKQDEIHKLKMELTEVLNPGNVTTG